MATVLESLKGVNSYPIPLRTINQQALIRGVNLDEEATQEILTGRAYRLTYADLLMWLAFAPDISQGGQSFSFTDEQRLRFRRRAMQIYGELEEDEVLANTAVYGYKGSRL